MMRVRVDRTPVCLDPPTGLSHHPILRRLFVCLAMSRLRRPRPAGLLTNSASRSGPTGKNAVGRPAPARVEPQDQLHPAQRWGPNERESRTPFTRSSVETSKWWTSAGVGTASASGCRPMKQMRCSRCRSGGPTCISQTLSSSCRLDEHSFVRTISGDWPASCERSEATSSPIPQGLRMCNAYYALV